MGWEGGDEEEAGKRENTGIEKKTSKEELSAQGEVKSHSPAPLELHPPMMGPASGGAGTEGESKHVLVFPGTISVQPLMKGAE